MNEASKFRAAASHDNITLFCNKTRGQLVDSACFRQWSIPNYFLSLISFDCFLASSTCDLLMPWSD